MPRDPASRNETLREPVVGPVNQVRRLMELRRHSERVPHPRLVAPGIVERTLGLTLMNIGQLIKHLPQRPHRRRQLPDHPIHLRRLIEPPTRVRQPRNASEASAASAIESKNVETATSWNNWIESSVRCAAQPDVSTRPYPWDMSFTASVMRLFVPERGVSVDPMVGVSVG